MFDPALEGLWKTAGAVPPFRTYRIDSVGRYFVANPAASFSFNNGGQGFDWGGLTYTRKFGVLSELVGVWTADEGGEEMHFRGDGSATIHWTANEEYFGAYELRNGATMLWYEEFRSVVSTTGSVVTFDPPYAQDRQYLYSVSGNVWSLSDPGTGIAVLEYERIPP